MVRNFSLEIANVGVGVTRTPTCTSAPVGIRTLNLLIRSQALCPLSYEGWQKYYTFNPLILGFYCFS